MISRPKPPSHRDLLIFGLLLPAFVVVFGAILRWGWGAPQGATWFWIVGSVLTAVFWLVPPCRSRIYLGWMYAALPIGWVVSHLLLSAIFYLVMTPIGLLMRLFRYDPMCRRLDRQARTYWLVRSEKTEPTQYFRQY